jgi:hypothetical protein
MIKVHDLRVSAGLSKGDRITISGIYEHRAGYWVALRWAMKLNNPDFNNLVERLFRKKTLKEFVVE